MKLLKYKKTIAASLVAASSTAYFMQPVEFKTYIHGSPNVPHDVYYGLQVDSEIDFGLYCHDSSDLLNANVGDIVISMRAGSVNCGYANPKLPTIAIMGWDNTSKFVGDKPIPNAITISNGSAYGMAIDYYIDTSSLSAAMPEMANIINAINKARIRAGMQPLKTEDIKRVLDSSSQAIKKIGGRYYGQMIDLKRAIEISIIPTSTTLYKSEYGIVSTISYLLLEEVN